MTHTGYKAACDWLTEDPYPEDRDIGIDELQNMGGAGFAWFGRRLAWYWVTYQDDRSRELLEHGLLTLYLLSDTEPAAAGVLGHAYEAIMDSDPATPLPDPLAVWRREQLRDRNTSGWSEGLSGREYLTAKAGGSLKGVIADAFVFALVEMTRRRFGIPATRNETSDLGSACDAVGFMWQSFGGDHVKSQDATRKRYYRARKRIEAGEWWGMQDPAQAAATFLTWLLQEHVQDLDLPI